MTLWAPLGKTHLAVDQSSEDFPSDENVVEIFYFIEYDTKFSPLQGKHHYDLCKESSFLLNSSGLEDKMYFPFTYLQNGNLGIGTD